MRRESREGAQPIWTAERLQNWLTHRYGRESIVVLAHREPIRHDRTPRGQIVASRPGGGLVTVLEPLLRASSGTWVAHGAGTADRDMVDSGDRFDVPPATTSYRLRRVWLDAAEEGGYYRGFANEMLWPLCHRTYVPPVFRAEDFDVYRAVNLRFADAACEEARRPDALIFVHDYHFALAPQRIQARLPSATIVTFWHIPWPHRKRFARCARAAQLLEGLLGSSLIGMQTADDCDHFMDAVEQLTDARVDRTRNLVTYNGHATMVRAYPVSVEWPCRWSRHAPGIPECRESIRQQLGVPADVQLGVGIDRLDYTKGLVEKFRAIERLLAVHAELRGRFVFAQVAAPTRSGLSAYDECRARVLAIVDRINTRFGGRGYRPIILLTDLWAPADVNRLLRAADVCYVGSLHDGMNLVAKEFVAARDDERGVLVLSRFAGAARELTEALIVNPYSIESGARSLAAALSMTGAEQSDRMRGMRTVVAECNTYRWAIEILADAAIARSRASAALTDGDRGLAIHARV